MTFLKKCIKLERYIPRRKAQPYLFFIRVRGLPHLLEIYMDLFDKCRVEIVEKATAENVYPYFHQIESKQAPEVIMEGSRRIMLGSNNYLGLTSNPDVIAAGVRALEKYGSGCSGSRFLNGTLDLHVQLESELADFLNKEDVVTFSTGFQSNLGIISAIAGRGDYIFCDKENHASIYDGCKLSYAKTIRFNHSDMAHLETALQSVPLESGKLIVTDGVFSMGGDICKLPEIVELAQKYKCSRSRRYRKRRQRYGRLFRVDR